MNCSRSSVPKPEIAFSLLHYSLPAETPSLMNLFARPERTPSLPEFVGLMALMQSLVALTIDAMIPALQALGVTLEIAHPNDAQLVIGLLFLGLAIGQLFFGPLSDSIGRKPAIQIGIGLFSIGCLLSVFSTSFTMMLFGRFLQGVGLAGPRIVSIALIRDLYVGDSMAKVMSFVMSVFILIPAIAPAVGQGIMHIWNWQAIFALFLCLGAIVSVWFGLRQPETLKLDRRIPFTPQRLFAGVKEVCLNRRAFGHTIAAGLIFGPFVAYLSMSQQILQIQYGLGEDFPLYFALLAFSIGAAFFTNSHLVVRYGISRMVSVACPAIAIWGFCFLGVVWFHEGQPSLLLLILYLQVTFFFMGILFGNLNAMAMQTLGHIAGIGAAIVGFISTTVGVTFGYIIGQLYDQSITPLVIGYILGSALSILAIRWANQGNIPSTGVELTSVK